VTDFIFSENDVNLAIAEVVVEELSDLRHIFVGHESEFRPGSCLRQ